MSESSPKTESLFAAALAIESPNERANYLDQACGADQPLRAQVEELLAAYPKVERFLESPNRAPVAAIGGPALSEQPGTVIGPYKLLQQIGEGGMGVVWMAEQTHPVHRKVALKVIKPGMDSRQVIARFEAERQALAMMDHVNIARVFDGGAWEEGRGASRTVGTRDEGRGANQDSSSLAPGSSTVPPRPTPLFSRPYFVMELVHGVPITKYCDDNHLTPRERLELFVPVCQAIQHAHQKGIIHRDIKPTNVMVTLYDGKPVPKVIDFGVAKATEQKLTERTLFTQYGTMVGTLEYMSPEQAEMSALGVDTRSDIYSLGVLLYELLTGSTPLTHKRMKEAAYAEILRMIKEEEPPKPSTRLSDSGEALASISANRHTEPAKLTKLVRGELDWIVMKCLEKDRNRRYETANGFAADVQRYLSDEPVLACPPTAGYRLRKFARRNKAGLAVAALVLFFLVLLGSGAGWAVRNQTAQQAEFERERLAQQAEAERAKADRQHRLTAQVELVLNDVDRLEREQKWPEALAAARRAEAAVTGGEADAATAERVRERLKDLEFLDRLEQIRMQRATIVEGRFDNAGLDREYARAFHDYGLDIEALAVETSIDRLKGRPALAIPLAAALDDWVYNRRLASERDAAGWKRLVAVARGIDPEPLRDRLRSTWGQPVSEVQDDLRRLADSIDVRAQHPATLFGLALALRRLEHADSDLRLLRDAQFVHPGDFWLNFELGFALYKQKDHEGAIRFYTAAVSLRPLSVVAYNNLGNALRAQGKLDEAIAAHRKAIELDPKYAGPYNNLGIALRDHGKPAEAIAAHRKAIEIDPKNTTAYNNLGTALSSQGKPHEAIAAYRKAIEIDPKYSRAYSNLGGALSWHKKPDEALAAHRKAIELDPKHAYAYFSLGATLHKQGKPGEAIAAYRKSIELDPNEALSYFGLATDLSSVKKWDEAIAAYRKCIELARPYYAAGAAINLGQILSRQNRLDEAIAAYRKAIEVNQDYATESAYVSLGKVLRKFGSVDRTDSIFRELDRVNREAFRRKPDDARTRKALAQCLNGWAWTLAILVDPKQRDPDRAVSLAQEAAELVPKDGVYWRTLGVAHYRTGNWTAARAALDKSRELGFQKSSNLFFLAMAHWQLGEKHKARECYDQAVQWMDKNRPHHQELRVFRAEAAELLELKKKK